MAASIYDKVPGKGLDKEGNKTFRYRKDKKNFVSPDNVPEVVKEALTDNNIVDETGLVIVEDKGADFGKDELAKAEQEAEQDNAENSADDEDSAEDQPTRTEEPAKPAQPAPAAPAAPVVDPNEAQPLTPSIPEAAAQALADTPARAFKSKTPQSKPGMGFPRKNGKTVDIFDMETPHTALRSVGGNMVPLSAKNYREKTDSQIEARLKELGFDVVELDAFEQAKPKQNDTRNDDDFDDVSGSLSDDI